MRLKYFILIILILNFGLSFCQEFDLILNSAESGTKNHQARNSIILDKNYSYTPNGGSLTVDIVNPIFSGSINYSSFVDPSSRTLDKTYMVGSTKGAFNVNALGGATYTIPLIVPKGVGGFTPAVSLNYSSNSGNGIAGYGWNIGGLSTITRMPQTYYHDGTSIGVDLTTTDRFALDGQRLICVSGAYGSNNSEYRTEIDNFSKIICLTDGTATPKKFLVKTKSGETIKYGYEWDSDQTIDGLTDEISWYIDKRTDLYGNKIEYEYLKQNGHNYIGEIKYGPNTITFYYKERQDKIISYFLGSTLQQDLILDRVEMKYNSNLIKKYELKYNYHSGYAILNEVIEYGVNNSRYNSTVFSYEYPSDNCDSDPYFHTNSYISKNYIQYAGDFNGDGKTDIFTLEKTDRKDWRLYLLNSYGVFDLSDSGSFPTGVEHIIATDLNGDGLDDLCIYDYRYAIYYGSWVEYIYSISTGTSMGPFYSLGSLGSVDQYWDPHYDYSADFDGDGVNDCLKKLKTGGNLQGDNRWYLFTMHHSSMNTTMSQKYTGTIPSWGDKDYVGDFNGDGKSDIWIFDDNGIKIYTINGNSLTLLYSNSYPKKDHLFRLGDYNGDGKMDIFIYGYGSYEWSDWQIHLSTGIDFKVNYFAKKKSNIQNDVVYTGDFNGDGRTDILALSKNSSNNPCQYYFFTNLNATDVSSKYYERSEYNKDYRYTFRDFDGNGKTDILVTNSSNGYKMGKLKGKTHILLSKFADGLNNKGSMSYRKLSEEYSNYEKGTTPVNFPIYTYIGPLNVINKYKENYYISSLNQDYSYKGLKIHRQGKGALGYERITVEESHFNTKSETNLTYDDTYFQPSTLVVNNYIYDELVSRRKNIFNRQITNYVTGLDPIFPHVSYALNQNILTEQQDSTTFVYDSTIKGSLKEAQQKFDNGVTKTITNKYYNNDINNWYIGRIKESTVKFEKNGEATQSNKTTFTYYNDGKLKPDFIKHNVGTDWEYSLNHDYYANGNIKQLYKQAPELGNLDTDYEYEADGIRIKKITDPLRLTTDYEYDNFGRLIKETDHRGNETTFSYDNMGRLTTQTNPNGFVATTIYDWTPDNSVYNTLYTITNSGNDGSQSKVWYDKEGRELRNDVKVLGGSWVYTITKYDWKGRMSKKYEPSTTPVTSSNYTLYEYDDKNRIKKITTAGNKITNISYAGNRVTHTSEGMTSWKEKDSQGLLVKASDFGGTITYSYYPNGQIKSINHPGGVTSMKYDLAGNQIELNDPDAGIITYKYNAYGQIIQQINAKGDVTDYLYGRYNNIGLLDKYITNSKITNYSYDSYKQLSGISTPEFNRTFSYATTGVKGRLIAITDNIDGSSFTTNFDYDSKGRLYKYTHASGVVEENVYDNNSGLLEKIKADGTVVWDIDAINEYGQVTSAKYGANLIATMNYNMGFPDNVTVGNIYHYNYDFDTKFGWPNYRENLKHSNLKEYFGYNNLRLDSIWGSTTNGLAYATNGNILRKNDLGIMEYDGNKVTDLYTQDPNLVPTDQQNIEYTWFERVKTISEGEYVANFVYNSDKQRCKMTMKKNGATQYTRWYVGGSYIKEVKGSITTQYTWLGGDAYSAPAVSVKIGNAQPTIYYILRDYLGSITHVVKANDLTYNEYSFDAWGRRRSANDWSYTLDANDNELFAARGYTGHEHLPEFGLINMNGRVYDPLLGRFLSPDNYMQAPDYTQNFNRYSYCLNNPLIYTDPSGELYVIDDLIVAGVGFTVGYVSHGFSTGNWGWNAVGAGGISAGMALLSYYTGGGFSLAAGGSFSGGTTFAEKFAINSILSSFTPSFSLPITDNFSLNFSAGIGFGSNKATFAGMSLSGTLLDGKNSYTAGLGLGTNYKSWGVSASFNDGEFGIGYYNTYYGNAKGPDGLSNKQVVGGLSITSNQFSVRLENDFLAFRGHDRWRSSAIELGFWGGDVVLGTHLYNNDPESEIRETKVNKEIKSKIWGRNKHNNGGWVNGLTYTSPLYIGVRNGNHIYRAGYSHRLVQDATQNFVHKYGFLGLPFGYQNYYANYSKFNYGPYYYQGYYNPYSLWGK